MHHVEKSLHEESMCDKSDTLTNVLNFTQLTCNIGLNGNAHLKRVQCMYNNRIIFLSIDHMNSFIELLYEISLFVC